MKNLLSRHLAQLLLCAVSITAANGQTFTVLHAFNGGGDGASPNGVILDRGGNLYGTTLIGGSGSCDSGCGSVFRLTQRQTGWTFATLYKFHGGTDGGLPSSVTIGPDGSLFGATEGYGVNQGGTIFNLKPPSSTCPTTQCPWSEQTRYSFPASPGDGASPIGQLKFDTQGNLYGATLQGGTPCTFETGCGTVFELSPAQGQWVESRRYNFSPGTDPHHPVGIDLDAAGNVVGASHDGGVNDAGAVFTLTPTNGGWTNEILLSFDVRGQGGLPEAGVTVRNGNIFGTTSGDGPLNGGTVWELACCNWDFQPLYSFSYSFPTDGVGPSSNLVFDTDGNIYGTTNLLGTNGLGNVFKLTANGDGNYTYRSLYDFTGAGDGKNPGTIIAIDGSGGLYGTAQGGTHNSGVVWKISQ